MCPQSADGLEDIDDALVLQIKIYIIYINIYINYLINIYLVLHSLQNNRQRDKDAGPADARAEEKDNFVTIWNIVTIGIGEW